MLRAFRRLVPEFPLSAGGCPRRARRLSTASTADPPAAAGEVGEADVPGAAVGQPTCRTHPHLVPPGHLTCGVTQAEYRQRRETLVARLAAQMPDAHRSHIVVIPAACKQYMSDKIPYVFRQHSDFFYLTGCLEPGAALVLLKTSIVDSYQSVLFVHEKDEHAELWEGPRTGCSLAAPLFAVDEARPVHTLLPFLHKLVSSSKSPVVWYCSAAPANPTLHASLGSLARAAGGGAAAADPQRALHLMRLIKSPAEVRLMKDTCHIGAQAMNMAMACTKPGISEHTVDAVLEYTSRTAGAEHPAFPPVVAGGARATHIHYVANNQILGADEMLLVDSGSQRWLYNSDISRTWPVSGKFSRHHRILYELVLAVQKRLIELLGEQRPPLDQLFDTMCRLLGKHLQEEGIIPQHVDGNELISRAYRLCPHHVSHYLGLDVHDTPLVKRNIPVQPGMVVTIEPGVYIAWNDTSVPAEFRGAGVRVEDDVLVTEAAPLVLTASAVKEVADVEALVGKQSL